jgi:hypothetical protein
MLSMTSEVDFDARLSGLEQDWRREFEASIAARAAYQMLAGRRSADAESLDAARERMDRAEAEKARILTAIDRLRGHSPGSDGPPILL